MNYEFRIGNFHLEVYGNDRDGWKGHGGNISTQGLTECPFCASTNIDITNTHTPCYWGECLHCGAQGPNSTPVKSEYTKTVELVKKQHLKAFKSAVKKWNRRKQPKPKSNRLRFPYKGGKGNGRGVHI